MTTNGSMFVTAETFRWLTSSIIQAALRYVAVITVFWTLFAFAGPTTWGDLVNNYDHMNLGSGNYRLKLIKPVDGTSGGAHYGQRFLMDFNDAAGQYALNSISFFKGNSGTNNGAFAPQGALVGKAGAVYLDIYDDFKSISNFGQDLTDNGFTFLGSSTNTVDWNAASLDDTLTWAFSGITLLDGKSYLAVFSVDNVADGLGGLSMRHFSTVAGTGDALFANGTILSSGDDNMVVEASAVPEPSSFLFLCLIGIGLVAATAVQALRSRPHLGRS